LGTKSREEKNVHLLKPVDPFCPRGQAAGRGSCPEKRVKGRASGRTNKGRSRKREAGPQGFGVDNAAVSCPGEREETPADGQKQLQKKIGSIQLQSWNRGGVGHLAQGENSYSRGDRSRSDQRRYCTLICPQKAAGEQGTPLISERGKEDRRAM